MPFALVIDEEAANGDEVRVSKTSVCGSWGAIAGEIRYFADKMGVPRAGIEGTQVPMAMIRRYAQESEPELDFDPGAKRSPLVLRRRVTYFGFDLQRETEPIDEFPAGMEARARRILAEAVARGEARHPASRHDRPAVEEIRETWKRSAGQTSRLGLEELAAIYEQQLLEQNVRSYSDFRRARLGIDAEAIVPVHVRERYLALPDHVEIRGREIPVRYDIEEGDGGPVGVAQLHLPEKIARTVVDEELPALDRPLRFIVHRGARGAARAATLDALREELDRPFTDEEIAVLDRENERRRGPRPPYAKSVKPQRGKGHKAGHRDKGHRDDARRHKSPKRRKRR
jgi:hypothetical protein